MISITPEAPKPSASRLGAIFHRVPATVGVVSFQSQGVVIAALTTAVSPLSPESDSVGIFLPQSERAPRWGEDTRVNVSLLDVSESQVLAAFALGEWRRLDESEIVADARGNLRLKGANVALMGSIVHIGIVGRLIAVEVRVDMILPSTMASSPLVVHEGRMLHIDHGDALAVRVR